MTIERLKTFSKRDQLLFLMSEFERARVWQEKGGGEFIGALERGLELIDFMLSDAKWREDILKLFTLRNELAKYYVGERTDSVESLSRAL